MAPYSSSFCADNCPSIASPRCLTMAAMEALVPTAESGASLDKEKILRRNHLCHQTRPWKSPHMACISRHITLCSDWARFRCVCPARPSRIFDSSWLQSSPQSTRTCTQVMIFFGCSTPRDDTAGSVSQSLFTGASVTLCDFLMGEAGLPRSNF